MDSMRYTLNHLQEWDCRNSLGTPDLLVSSFLRSPSIYSRSIYKRDDNTPSCRTHCLGYNFFEVCPFIKCICLNRHSLSVAICFRYVFIVFSSHVRRCQRLSEYLEKCKLYYSAQRCDRCFFAS